jgi:HAD superfamily hydrolase (TIGR01459 family)
MAALAADYDALLLDQWGVIHDGVAAFPGVLDCLVKLRAAGKRVIIVSNAPRAAARIVPVLTRLGIDDSLYERVITSGDVARAAFARRDDPWYAALGPAFLFIGRASDADLLDGLDFRAADVADADFVLVTGPSDDSHGVEAYDDVLRPAADRGLPMVCANPDLAVIRGGRRRPCSGAIAARYVALGGTVRHEGKPYPEIYEMCFEALGAVDRRRVLAVGDGLETDIAGARAAGIDSLLVTGGLLADAWGADCEAAPDPDRLAAACAAAAVAPNAAIPTFVW